MRTVRGSLDQLSCRPAMMSSRTVETESFIAHQSEVTGQLRKIFSSEIIMPRADP